VFFCEFFFVFFFLWFVVFFWCCGGPPSRFGPVCLSSIHYVFFPPLPSELVGINLASPPPAVFLHFQAILVEPPSLLPVSPHQCSPFLSCFLFVDQAFIFWLSNRCVRCFGPNARLLLGSPLFQLALSRPCSGCLFLLRGSVRAPLTCVLQA